jgi:ABC-type dipeptide/oligopeptide/nickel transport system permease subunit
LSSNSFTSAAWKRLKKNKGAIFGLVVIALALLLALTGYLIAPDASPNANRMMVEIGGEKPGFTKTFLQLKKEKPVAVPGFFERLLSGAEDRYQYLPVNSWQVVGDSMVVQKYMDEGVAERQAYSITQQLAVADPGAAIVQKKFWLGTDKYGRDILSRLIIG